MPDNAKKGHDQDSITGTGGASPPDFDYKAIPDETTIGEFIYRKITGTPTFSHVQLTGKIDCATVEHTLQNIYSKREKLMFVADDLRKFKEDDGAKYDFQLFNSSEIIAAIKLWSSEKDTLQSRIKFKINPFSPKISAQGKYSKEHISNYKYCLLSSKKMSVDEQFGLIKFLKLPYAMITYDGDGVLYTLIQINATRSKEMYRRRTRFLAGFCKANGFLIEEECLASDAEACFPGFCRKHGDKIIIPELISDYQSSEFPDYESWEKWAKQYVRINCAFFEGISVLDAQEGEYFKDVFSDGMDYWVVYNDTRGLTKLHYRILLKEIIKHLQHSVLQEFLSGDNPRFPQLNDFNIPVKKFTYDITLHNDDSRFYNEYECGFLKDIVAKAEKKTVTEMPTEYKKLLDNLAGQEEGEWLINHMSAYLHLLCNDFKDAEGNDVHLETIPVLYGTQGSGKNRFMKYFGLAISKNGYVEVSKIQFESAFNTWQKNAMIFLNEFAENKLARKSTSAQLKLLTSESQMINEKGKPQYFIKAKAYIVVAGNDSANTYGMLDIEDCDRRFAYICGGKNVNAMQNNIMDPIRFEQQKEDFINYLLNYNCDFKKANTVFSNAAKASEIEGARSSVEQLVKTYLEENPDRKEYLVQSMIEWGEKNGYRNISSFTIGRRLSKLGYTEIFHKDNNGILRRYRIPPQYAEEYNRKAKEKARKEEEKYLDSNMQNL